MQADIVLLYQEKQHHEAAIARLDRQAATSSFNRSYHEAELRVIQRAIEAKLAIADGGLA